MALLTEKASANLLRKPTVLGTVFYGMKTEQRVRELSPEDTAIGTDSKQETKLLLFFPGTRR